MGTFLGCVGTPHIPEERQKEFRGRMLRLLREGGMMNTEEVNLFGKKISLLHFPEPDEDGFFQVCYNSRTIAGKTPGCTGAMSTAAR